MLCLKIFALESKVSDCDILSWVIRRRCNCYEWDRE